MNVVVKLQIPGIHQWSECPFKDVDFLNHPHRHLFHIVCKRAVTHDNRDVEVIRFKQEITDWINDAFPFNGVAYSLGETSCEMLCRTLADKFNLCYCSVLEDGENGAEISIQ